MPHSFPLLPFSLGKTEFPPQASLTISPHVLHFKQPAGTSRGIYTTRKLWLLTLCSPLKPQVKGMGECAPLPQLSCDYETLEALLGNSPSTIPAEELPTWLQQVSSQPLPALHFALETALYDWKNGGTSALFHTPFTRGEEGITTNGLVWMGSFEEMQTRIEEKLAQGFHCVKLKVGAIDFDREEALVRSIRERFPPEVIELRLDANGGFTPADALDKLTRLSRFHIHSIEQPIRQGLWEEMAHLCRRSPIDIALDEELIGIHSSADKCRLLDTIRPNYIILKPSLHGGMGGTAEWITLAAERGIGSWITSALESNIGLNAVAQLAAAVYPSSDRLPQGLGTGMLFTDNFPSALQMRGEQLWRTQQ